MDPAWQPTPWLIPQAVAVLVTLPAMVIVARRAHRAAGARWILVVLMAAALWAFCGTMEFATANLALKRWFASFGYLGAIFGPFALFHFAWSYIRAGEAPPIRLTLGLLGLGLVPLGLVFTHPLHDLIWKGVSGVVYDGAVFAHFERGPLFWLAVVYAYGLMAAASLILIRHTFGLAPIYRRQSITILLATLAPWLFSIAYMLRIGPMPELDHTPVGFALTALLISWGSLRLHFLDIVPVAERHLFRDLPDPVFLVDHANRLVQANQAALERFPELGREADRSVPAALKDYPNLAEILYPTGEPMRHTAIREQGCWWDVRIRTVGGGAKGLAGMLVSLRDITALKAAETQLAQTKTDLERMLQRVQHLRQEAEKANREKSLFLAQVSHDVRGPLHAILGTAEVLREEADNPETDASLGTIRDAALILQRLTNDLLDLSRLEAGPPELRRETFTWQTVVDPLARILEPRFREKSLRFISQTEPEPLPALFGDSDMVRQILFNLIGNAVKFTDRGKVSLSARAMPGGDLRIQVADTGQGIPPDQLERIFEPFDRGGRGLTGPRDGTGLGLAIARRLVKAMNGRIRAHSVPGHGSVFSLELPLLQPPPEPAADRAATGAGQPESTGALRVLLADDDALSRRVTQALLERCGCKVTPVAGGVPALTALREHVFDAVVLDGQMQDLEGWETARRIRLPETGVTNPDIPVIAVTAEQAPERLALWQVAGVRQVLAKPVDGSRIREALRTCWPLPEP